jgi:16S rRNA (adenine1518-N6/adenine1519-N6)-dimethyltransferase
MAHQPTKFFLKRQGLAPQKKLGQNFLVHERTPKRIVDLCGLTPNDTVLEVGVGLGALTRPLAAACSKVIGLEADSGIIRLHQQEQDLPANVELIHGDVLKVDFASLVEPGKRLKIVTNLPYSISSPFLFRLIEHKELIDFAVVMLQKELAQRLAAQPGTKEYGTPTVLLAACATVEPLLSVHPAEFHPQPKVDSLVIRLNFHPQPASVTALGEFNRTLFTRIVHAAFGQRRKTLLNGLASGRLLSDKSELIRAIEAAGISPAIRAEKLSPQEFVELTHALDQAGAASPQTSC